MKHSQVLSGVETAIKYGGVKLEGGEEKREGCGTHNEGKKKKIGW